MGKKSKAEKKQENVEEETEIAEEEMTYEDQLQFVLPISQPMADRKLAKKIYKCVKQARKVKKAHVGIKAVKKSLKKGVHGFLVLAGDTDPMDVLSHFPCYCEEKEVPYVWVPSRKNLWSTAVLVPPNDSYAKFYDAVYDKVKALPIPV